ncbi:hypothetical protein HDV00_012026, partial [Rhizophlyctis rosea]
MAPTTVRFTYAQMYSTSIPYSDCRDKKVDELGVVAWDGIKQDIAKRWEIEDKYVAVPIAFGLSAPALGISLSSSDPVATQIAAMAAETVELFVVPVMDTSESASFLGQHDLLAQTFNNALVHAASTQASVFSSFAELPKVIQQFITTQMGAAMEDLQIKIEKKVEKKVEKKFQSVEGGREEGDKKDIAFEKEREEMKKEREKGDKKDIA